MKRNAKPANREHQSARHAERQREWKTRNLREEEKRCIGEEEESMKPEPREREPVRVTRENVRERKNQNQPAREAQRRKRQL